MSDSFDVLVLGAGPAGSAVAQQLARAGHSVALADKKAFPRTKPCGEFLSPQCAPFLRELGVDEVLQARGMRSVHGMQLYGYGHRAVGMFRPVPGALVTHGFAVRREVLDTLLVEQAAQHGVELLLRHDCRDLLREADGRVVGAVLRDPGGRDRPLRARFVVGADGVHSRTARTLGLQRPLPWLDRFALTTRYTGVAAQECAEVHLFAGGYFAATAVDEDQFSVNLVLDRGAMKDHGNDWDAFMQRHLQQAPAFAQRLQGAQRVMPYRGIGPLAFRTTQEAVPGAALVGDACGYVDPITGEGIFFALATARLLAGAVAATLAQPAREKQLLHGYERARRRELSARMTLAALLQRGLRHRWFLHHGLSLLQRWPALADLLVTMTGDTMHPRDLLRPRYWRLFRRRVTAAARS